MLPTVFRQPSYKLAVRLACFPDLSLCICQVSVFFLDAIILSHKSQLCNYFVLRGPSGIRTHDLHRDRVVSTPCCSVGPCNVLCLLGTTPRCVVRSTCTAPQPCLAPTSTSPDSTNRAAAVTAAFRGVVLETSSEHPHPFIPSSLCGSFQLLIILSHNMR